MNAIAPIAEDENAIWRPSAALNPQRLEYLWGLTDRLAWSTSVPETLRGERKGNNFEPFDDRTILANVFAVVEQADRWNVSPFALLGSAAIVRGKLAFEGKVIAAVLESQFGVKLHSYFRGEPKTDNYHVYLCDEALPDDVLAELKPGYRHDRYRILDGSVAGWKTTGNGSPWRPETYGDMLIYRGTRQWARVHRAAAILGVLADDEVENLARERSAQAALPTTAQRFSPAVSRQGFDADAVAKQIEQTTQMPMGSVDADTGEVIEQNTEAQSGAAAKTTPPGRKASSESAAPASDKPSSPRVDGEAGNAGGNQPQTNSSEDSRSSSPAAGDDAQESGEASSSLPSLSRAAFEEFSGALARIKKVENLPKAKDEFFRGKGMKPNDKEKALFQTIYTTHETRVKNDLDVGKVMAEITGYIAEDVPEDRL
ncbi:MAG: hypothetical protein KIS86_06290 [Devosia sp.]|nr:hypothetical protein [Devosia sp.]